MANASLSGICWRVATTPIVTREYSTNITLCNLVIRPSVVRIVRQLVYVCATVPLVPLTKWFDMLYVTMTGAFTLMCNSVGVRTLLGIV